MQNQQPDQQGGPGDQISMKGTFHAIYFVCLCHATCFTPFLRRRFGLEALGFNGLGALLILLLVSGFTGPPMVLYLVIWLIALAGHRIRTVSDAKRGDIRHSRYGGDPWLAQKIPFVKKDRTAKLVVEPLFCLMAAPAIGYFSEPIGLFFVAGAISLAVVQAVEKEAERVRIQRMHDASIEQRHVADLFRNGPE